MLTTASDNLKVIVPGILGSLAGQAFEILALPLVWVMLGYVLWRYNRIMTERQDILNFDAFQAKIQLEIMQLRTTANDNAQLEGLWRSYFRQEPTFSKAA